MGLILPRHIQQERALKAHCEEWARGILWAEYPHHLFQVDFNITDQSFRIDHLLMGQVNGACMYIAPTEQDVPAALIRAGGEMLERCGLPRKALEDWQQYEDAKPVAKEAFKCR